jgi:hypothetical protein
MTRVRVRWFPTFIHDQPKPAHLFPILCSRRSISTKYEITAQQQVEVAVRISMVKIMMSPQALNIACLEYPP